MVVKKILHSEIIERFNSIFETIPEIPDDISDNLAHKLRPYQENSFRHFLYVLNHENELKKFNHLLFHMATGAGKTLVLASVILELYKRGYKNFLFFVNSEGILAKTKENLINAHSLKYLFNRHGINIDGENVQFQIVDTFPLIPEACTVYLKLTTIQKLHYDLTYPSENSISFENLSYNKFALLADEAHHINVVTKKGKLSTIEINEKNWESTISKILDLNNENRLIEFTATIDLTNELLFEKYKDKIVYQYDLKRFIEDGYSKNVYVLKADQSDEEKMLNAVLLSQYRKYIAEKYNIELKPIILFKSNKIDISKKANQDFFTLLENLHVEKLSNHILVNFNLYKDTNSIWSKVFEYYLTLDLAKVIKDLNWEFNPQTTLNVNDKSFISESNSLLLNTLEDSLNPIRAIFAVAKLNEGWDVLNLFDIVRISEGAIATRKNTDSEAQLIGRGARYFPFKLNSEISYQRRFDYSNSELNILESMHYHTINDNGYIKNLYKSLEASNVKFFEDEVEIYEAKIKNKIRESKFYNSDQVYINTVREVNPLKMVHFSDFNIPEEIEIPYNVGEETRLQTQVDSYYHETKSVALKLNKHLLRKGIQRNKFFTFDNLNSHIPILNSIAEFIDSPDFLGGIKLILQVPKNYDIKDLSYSDYIYLIDKYLIVIAQKIKSNSKKSLGNKQFKGIPIKDIFKDYSLSVSNNGSTIQKQELLSKKNMKHFPWYIYDVALVNGWEYNLIEYIADCMDELESKYDEVYLIRNEKKLKLTEFDGVRGFMPDFLLYLKAENAVYQVFIEPKRDDLRIVDQWKEDMLLNLNQDVEIEILSSTENVNLIGIKFYSLTPQYNKLFKEDFNFKVLQK